MSAPAASTTARAIDERALARTARRLAALPQPPWLHGEVARRMSERLALVRAKPQRIVEWNGFLGASAQALAAACPGAERIVVEPDAALAARSARDAAHAPSWWRRMVGRRVPARLAPSAVHLADADQALPGDAQLLWSNMLLHAVPDPPSLFARWEPLVAPDGFVMFSCLGPGTLVELRSLYAECGFGTPGAAFVDMHDLGDMLVQTGFADPVMDQETLTLHWDDAAKTLAELRTLGGNAAPERHAGLRTPRWRRRLEDALHARCGAGGRIELRFEVVYGHAFKGAPRVRAGETTVSLSAMRQMVRGRGSTLR